MIIICAIKANTNKNSLDCNDDCMKVYLASPYGFTTAGREYLQKNDASFFKKNLKS